MPPPGVVSSIEIHQESGVTGFEFPLTTEADIERLEEAVTTKRLVRLQYVSAPCDSHAILDYICTLFNR